MSRVYLPHGGPYVAERCRPQRGGRWHRVGVSPLPCFLWCRSFGCSTQGRLPDQTCRFAAGLEHHAPVSVFPPYVRGFSTAEHLQLAAGAHIRLIAGCYRKNGECAEHSEKIVSVVCELVRLGWPRRLVVGFLFKFDHYMFPHTQTRCRAIAVWIRRHKTWYRLARKTAHSGPNADGSTHRAFFEYLLEGSNRAPRIEQT